jgi:DNA transposition AAA+ family ATPase
MVATLETARLRHTARTIIGEPGSGKTMAISMYKEKNPLHTFVITINSLVTVADIIIELLGLLGLPVIGSRAARVVRIIARMREIKQSGGNPLIIFDEAENIESKTMKLLKGLFDGLNRFAAIVLVGTSQLVRKMQGNKRRDKDAAPQFYRRYYPGMVYLADMDRKFKQFFEGLKITDMGLRKLLCRLCENYGELNAYLEPVMREAAEKGVEVSEELFREYHDMRD